jgi:hypothetical protein
VVIVLATEPKVRGFKPGRGWILECDKNPQCDFLPAEVEPAVPRRKILRHVKEPWRVWQRYCVG